MMDERINVGKKGAGFMECGCSCDKSRLFCVDIFNQKLESTEQIDNALKINTRNVLKFTLVVNVVNVIFCLCMRSK